MTTPVFATRWVTNGPSQIRRPEDNATLLLQKRMFINITHFTIHLKANFDTCRPNTQLKRSQINNLTLFSVKNRIIIWCKTALYPGIQCLKTVDIGNNKKLLYSSFTIQLLLWMKLRLHSKAHLIRDHSINQLINQPFHIRLMGIFGGEP